MKRHLKALGVMIGAILLFKVVAIIIQLFMKYILKVNLLMNVLSPSASVRKVAGIESSLMGIAMDLIVFLILVIIFLNRGGLIERVKLNRGYKLQKLRFIVPATWGTIFVGGIFSAIAVKILGTNPVTQVMFNEMFKTPLGIIQAVIIAPIVEETLLRGVVFNYLRRDYKLGTAIILQALVFGILHGNVAQGFNAFIIGIVFAVIYIYTDSLWGDITAHMLTNGTVTFITLIRLGGNKNAIGVVSLLMMIIVIASLIIAINMYRKKVSKVIWQRESINEVSGVLYSENYVIDKPEKIENYFGKNVEQKSDRTEYKELKKPSKAVITIGIIIIVGISFMGAEFYKIHETVENNYNARVLFQNTNMSFMDKLKYGIEAFHRKEEYQEEEKKIENENNYIDKPNLIYVDGQATSKGGISSNIYSDTEYIGISNETIYKKYNNQILENGTKENNDLIIKYYNPNNLTSENFVSFYNEIVKPSKKTYYLLDIYNPSYGICFYVSGGFNVGDLDKSYIININNHMIIGNITKEGKIISKSGDSGREIPFILKN